MFTLDLKVGKVYRTRSGRRALIVEEDAQEDWSIYVDSEGNRYFANGSISSIGQKNFISDFHAFRESESLISEIRESEDPNSFTIEKGRTYISRSGKRVIILQHIPEGIVKTDDGLVLSRIPEHYVGSNQERYHQDGKMYQVPGRKYDPLEEEVVREGQEELDVLLHAGLSLKKTLSAAEATATKMGLFFNYTLLRLR